MIGQRAPVRTWPRAVLLCSLPTGVAVLWALLVIVAPSALIDDFVIIWGLSSTVTASVGALILWRRPGHAMGRLLTLVSLLFALSAAIGLVTDVIDQYQLRFGRLTEWAIAVAEALSTISLLAGSVVVIVRFPSGRRTSRMGLLIEGLIVVAVGGLIVGEVVPSLTATLEEVASLPLFATYPLAAIDVALRYRGAPPVERVQFRWLIAAASVTGVLVVLLMVLGDQIEWLWNAWILSTMLPTAAVGVAVLRYRLYEIDRIISRSLTYGALSVVLFTVFFATNILLQNAISPLVDDSVVATAVSTLLVASLFQPVRRRVQRVVDRRFHRARYDADRTVEAFGGRLRDSVDLPRLVGDLRQTVASAVEPTSTTVWLRAGRP
jgi:hypothetical protein